MALAPPPTEFRHVQNSLYVQVLRCLYWQRYTVFTRGDRPLLESRIYSNGVCVYTVRSSQRSVARPIAAIDRATDRRDDRTV